jgi:hypothetical protein
MLNLLIYIVMQKVPLCLNSQRVCPNITKLTYSREKSVEVQEGREFSSLVKMGCCYMRAGSQFSEQKKWENDQNYSWNTCVTECMFLHNTDSVMFIIKCI